jgi:small subunit ribosomal protein S12
VPTINQLVRKGRKNKKVKSKAPALQYTLNSNRQRRVRHAGDVLRAAEPHALALAAPG